MRLWNAQDRALVHEWPLHRAWVTFTPDSRVLALGLSHEFRFHDVTSKELVLRIRRDVTMHPGYIAFAPAAGLMALEMAPGVVHLKEIATGLTVARLEDPHSDRAAWLGLASDAGRLVVVAHYTRRPRLGSARHPRAAQNHESRLGLARVFSRREVTRKNSSFGLGTRRPVYALFIEAAAAVSPSKFDAPPRRIAMRSKSRVPGSRY